MYSIQIIGTANGVSRLELSKTKNNHSVVWIPHK